MKRVFSVSLTLVFLLVGLGLIASNAMAGEDFNYKKGDKIFADACGEQCPCKTMSRQAGKCQCNKDLVAATVDDVKNGVAMVKFADGSQGSFKIASGYQCGCGAACGCSTIAQQSGKCVCGKDLKPMK